MDWSPRLTSLMCRLVSPSLVCHANVAVDLLALFLVPYPLPSASLPASVLLSALSLLTAISFSVSRLQYHVGYRSHDILACLVYERDGILS